MEQQEFPFPFECSAHLEEMNGEYHAIVKVSEIRQLARQGLHHLSIYVYVKERGGAGIQALFSPPQTEPVVQEFSLPYDPAHPRRIQIECTANFGFIGERTLRPSQTREQPQEQESVQRAA